MTHIQKCPICDIEFKPADHCADDIEMGTCHAECLESSPVVDLDTGEQLPEGSKPETYLFAELDGQKPFAWYWYDSLGCLYMTGDARKPEVPTDAKPLYERPAPPPSSHLRGIETAPKDGTWFIAYQDGEPFPCDWRSEEQDEGPPREGWFDFFNRSFEDPTHWLPVWGATTEGSTDG